MKTLNPIKVRFVKVPTTNPYSDEEVQQIMLKDATEGNTSMQMGRTAMSICIREGWSLNYENLGAALNSLEVD